MIRLHLGDEPEALRLERKVRLPEAIEAFNQHGPGHAELTCLLEKGYQRARPTLYQRQCGKCAFCEMSVDQSHSPVEHFRPKGKAQNWVNGRWIDEPSHYWWLTWTWDNLFFSCNDCNNTAHKGNKFPIEPGSQRLAAPSRPASDPLPAEHFDLSVERPLLIDPRREDPLDHLQWKPVDRRQPVKRWVWTLEGLDLKGSTTAEVLALKRRMDKVGRHLGALLDLWVHVDRDWQEQHHDRARQGWDDLLQRFVEDPHQAFRAAAWCALQVLCSPAEQHRRGWRVAPRPQCLHAVHTPDTTGQAA